MSDPDAIDTAIVLGAGASKAEGLPMQAELMATFWELAAHPKRFARAPGGVPSLRKYVIEPLRVLFRSVLGVDVPTGRTAQSAKVLFPTFEEAFAMLDLALERQDEFPEFDRHWISDRRVNLVNLIALTLVTVLDRAGSTSGHHLALVRNLRRTGQLKKTAFISFNYDLLIDRAIAAVEGEDRIDYGFAIRSTPRRKRRPPPATSSVQLLKLHGSLNFAYCPSCGAVDDGGMKEIVMNFIPGAGDGTPFCSCGTVKHPVVVPPTFFKSLVRLHFQQVWAGAEEVLTGARRIVFCGYSFPDADVWFKYILKRALLRGGADGRPSPTVILVNDHQDKKPARREEEAERYRRFLGSQASLLHARQLSFGDFATDPMGVFEHSPNS